MSRYSLRLHRIGRPPVEEPLDAVDVEEARELARMRLLLTREFNYVDLRRRGRHVQGFDRDGKDY